MKVMKPLLNMRIAWVALHDLVMAGLGFQLAIILAHWADGTDWTQNPQTQGLAITLVLAAVIFWRQGLYRGIWHYASLRDLFSILRAVTLLVLFVIPLLFVWTRLDLFPRSTPLLQWLLTVGLLTGPRLAFRAWKDGNLHLAYARTSQKGLPVLLVGAGAGSESFIREMARRADPPYRPVGILDDKENRLGRDMHGVRVRGRVRDLEAIVTAFERANEKPHKLILTNDDIHGDDLRALVARCESLGLPLAKLPKSTDLRPGDGGGFEVRPVAVEDLLGRTERALDRAGMARLIQGKRVLVTGAGGSIGGELARQVAAFGPARIILFDVSEYNLYRIDLDLHETHPDLPRAAVLGDVRDRARLAQLFGVHAPDVVIHAAAYKHVPMAEMNVAETAMTNVLGTRHLAELSVAHGVDTMVTISTDKAVNPANVMGATKRVAEMVTQAMAVSQNKTRFVTVRFGNVLGSTGSVVPLFERQLARGGPLTVTHPDITRYFMTVREAVELILHAAAMPGARSEYAGKIYVLDMGEPVRIQDLARQMILLAGLRPDKDVKIVYTGLRPGEKLYEELLHESERLQPSSSPGIMLAAPRLLDQAQLGPALDRLTQAAQSQDESAVRRILQELVPEFQTAEVSQPS